MKKTTILVVDDNAGDRESVGTALIGARPTLRIDYCINGEDLMNYLKREKEYETRSKSQPAIIFLNLYMINNCGFSALREIKKNTSLNEIPVIGFTNSDQEHDLLNMVYRLGAADYVTKPTNFVQAIRLFKGLLDKHLK
ncbi:MAG: response regulator [Bacteroidota bacterium]